MTILSVGRQRAVEPPAFPVLARNSRFAFRLTAAHMNVRGVPRGFDLLTGRGGYKGGTYEPIQAALASTGFGRLAYQYYPASDNANYVVAIRSSVSSDLTLLALYPHAAGGNKRMQCGSGWPVPGFYDSGLSARLSNDTSVSIAPTDSLQVGTWYAHIARFVRGTGFTYFINGRYQGFASTGANNLQSAPSIVYDSDTNASVISSVLTATWDFAWPDDDLADLGRYPFQLVGEPRPWRLYFDVAAGGGGGDVTGGSFGALDATAGVAAGAVAVSGSSVATVGNTTGTAGATVAIAASSVQGLANVAGAATAAVHLYGDAAGALGAVTGVAAGAVAGAGSSAHTLEQVTGTATGVVGSTPITGASSVTVGAVTGLAAGAAAISGVSAAGVGSVTGAALGAVEAIGNSSRALDAVAGAATGVIGSAPIAGASAVVLVGVFGSAAGECQIRGASAGIVGEVTAPGDGAPTLTSDPRYTVRASRGRFVVTSPGRQFKVAA